MIDLSEYLSRWMPADLVTLLMLAAGAALGLLAFSLLWPVARRAAGESAALLPVVMRRARRPLRLLSAVLGTWLMAEAMGLRTEGEGTLPHLLLAAAIAVVGWLVLIWIDIAATRAQRRLALDAEDNLEARRQATQIRLLRQIGRILVFLLTVAIVLSTFPAVRSWGVSLFASAGVAGLVLGFAAQPLLTNLIAGIQIALTQPIRIDDVVIVEGEWGWIEEIGATYVVVRVWDLRRLVVPLSYFIEKPFQNWTRENADIIGSVFWYLDWTAPVGAIREKLGEIVRASPHWDGKVVNLQVVETDADVIHIRALVSAKTSPIAWDLRCEVREKMLAWLHEEHPGALPRARGEIRMADSAPGAPERGPRGKGPGSDGPGVPEEALPGGSGAAG